jgi:outer membrane protein insertion porin family
MQSTNESSARGCRERRLRGIARILVAASIVVASASGQTPPQPGPPAPSAQQQGPPSPDSKTEAKPADRQQPIVVAITVEGRKRYTEQQLLDALGQKIGQPLDRDVVDKGIALLWKVFSVKADVQYHDVAGGVELKLVVAEEPVDLEPRFIGNSDISTDTLKKWAQIQEKSELFLYQAPRVRLRLLEGYHREGYYFADVKEVVKGGEGETKGEAGEPDVIFEIREGPQVRVKDIVIEGNNAMPDTGMWWWRGGLQKLAKVDLDGPWLFNWKGSKFVMDTLDADVLAMRNVYRDRGWLDAVVEVENLEFSPDRSHVTIHVIVDEGEPYHVSRLSIQGFERTRDPQSKKFVETPAELIFPVGDLLALCKLKPGERYERTKQQQDATALRDFYGSKGYLSHPSLIENYWEFLEPALRYDAEKHEVDVTYRIVQGKQRYIREILFSGAEHTRDRVLRRQVRMLPGELADIKEIQKSLARITGTGYFTNDSAPLEHHDPVFRFVPVPTDPDKVDLEYVVEEGKEVNLRLGGGLDSSNGLYGLISLSMANFDITDLPSSLWSTFGEIYKKEAFHGAGQRLDLEWQPGTQVNAYRFHFLEPDIFRRQFDRYSFDLNLERRDRTYTNYDEDRFESRVTIGREFGTDFTVAVGYTAQAIDVKNVSLPLTDIVDPSNPPLPQGLLDQQGRSYLDGVIFNVQYRNLDSPLAPRQGFTGNWRNTVYGGPLGGDYQFLHSEVSFDFFRKLGDPSEDVQPGVHLRAFFGIAQPFGDTATVPYTERYFQGGYNNLRGFAYRGVGPNVGEVAIGGQTSLNASLEYRYPLYKVLQPGTYKEVEIFHMVLFADSGVLDPETWHIDPAEFRASVGFGFGLSYPIPLTFYFGFPVLIGPGDQRQLFSFNISTFFF